MPKGKIPADVERYVKEHTEEGKDQDYAWSLAWSRFCQFKEPNSPHCKQDSYFPNRPELKKNSGLMLKDAFQRALRASR